MPQLNASSTPSPDTRNAGKPKRQYRTANQWREIVEAFHRSDLTRTEFCKQHGIAASGLYNWQRKLEQPCASPSSNKDAFVEIQPPAASTDTPSPIWDVELELGHGRVLRVRIA